MRRILVDTHVVVWALTGSRRLRREAERTLTDPRHELLWSVVVTAELALLDRLGRLRFEQPLPTVIGRVMEEWAFRPLPVEHEHALEISNMPLHHRDPFDRLLVAQALVEDVAVISADIRFDEYGVRRLEA